MEKITPTVVTALILGGVVGYIIKGMITPSANPQTISDSISQEEITKPAAEPGSKEAKIAEALSAAPESVAKNAAVMDFPATEGGAMVELQKGTNDWTCMPDYPGSPGKDPMCLDKQGMFWLTAYVTKTEPGNTQMGTVYMLAGGSDASNTDPFATKPTEGDDWVTSPSHIMTLPVGELDKSVYSTDPKNGGPWIMWAGTPYEHLMIPVK